MFDAEYFCRVSWIENVSAFIESVRAELRRWPNSSPAAGLSSSLSNRQTDCPTHYPADCPTVRLVGSQNDAQNLIIKGTAFRSQTDCVFGPNMANQKFLSPFLYRQQACSLFLMKILYIVNCLRAAYSTGAPTGTKFIGDKRFSVGWSNKWFVQWKFV